MNRFDIAQVEASRVNWPRNIINRGGGRRHVGVLNGIGWIRVDRMISMSMLRLLLLHWWLPLQRCPTRTLCSLIESS